MSLSSDRHSFNAPTTPENAAAVPIVCFDEGGKTGDRKTGVVCPNCQSELVIGEVRECQFAGCADCGGMLYQARCFWDANPASASGKIKSIIHRQTDRL